MSIDELLRQCRSLDLDGLAITDHDTLEAASEAMEKRGGLIVVSGLEVSAHGAHIIALDAAEPVPKGLPIPDTVEQIRDQGATAVLAHPFSLLKLHLEERIISESKFDAIEVANASHFPYDWLRSRNAALAERLRLPQTGGSDAHTLDVVGRAYTVLESDSRDVEDIINSIKEGRSIAEGSGVSLVEKLKIVTQKRK
jgi:hypothetical protein